MDNSYLNLIKDLELIKFFNLEDKKIDKFCNTLNFYKKFKNKAWYASLKVALKIKPELFDKIILPQIDYGNTDVLFLPNYSKLNLDNILDFKKENTKINYLLIILESGSLLNLNINIFSNYLYLNLTVYLYENSYLKIVSVNTNSKRRIFEFNYKLIGQSSCVEHIDLCALKNSDQYGIKIKQEHIGLKTKSSVISKVIIKDQAQAFNRSLINIENKSFDSIADQKQISLTLSNQAKSCAIPSLEIKNNKVKCSHGAASGKFDEEKLWYLQSRGLSKDKSQELIIDAFFSLEEIDNNLLTSLKQYLINL